MILYEYIILYIHCVKHFCYFSFLQGTIMYNICLEWKQVEHSVEYLIEIFDSLLRYLIKLLVFVIF